MARRTRMGEVSGREVVASKQMPIQETTALAARLGAHHEAQLSALRAQITEQAAKLDLAKRLVNRLPLCQDHRDKFSPEDCQACGRERAERQAAKHAARCTALEKGLRYHEDCCGHTHAMDPGNWIAALLAPTAPADAEGGGA